MLPYDVRLAAAVVTAALALAGCGGGSGEVIAPSTASTPSTPGGGSEVPASALSSVDGLVAYLKQLIAQTSDSSEPVVLGNAVLPVDDRAEPSPVQ